jgi:hypothetical protein
MVKKRHLTVEFVHAETRVPFQEHTASDGKEYAEVEPDVDYYIRIARNDSGPTDSLQVHLELDGERFSGWHNLPRGTEAIKGISSKNGNRKTKRALRFHLQESWESSKSGAPWFGCLKVKVYDTIDRGMVKKYHDDQTDATSRKSSSGRWEGGTVDGNISKTMKKVVRSVEGRHAVVKRMSPVAIGTSYVRDIVKGRKLETIELYYCTALGLVRAGVLPKPPNFELDLIRKEKPFSPKNITPGLLRCLEVEPTLVVTGAAVEELGIEEKRSAIFDLTEADSDPEEEEASRCCLERR